MIRIIFTVLIFYNFFPSQDDFNTLNIEITELNNNNGSIVLELLDENENQILAFNNIPIVDNRSIFKIDSLSSGKYALRFFNDDNENGKLDTNLFGIPKEEFGEDWSDLIGDILVDIIDEQEGNKIESDNREDSIN